MHPYPLVHRHLEPITEGSRNGIVFIETGNSKTDHEYLIGAEVVVEIDFH